MSAFFAVILTAIKWLGATAFTGAGGVAVGAALTTGVMVVIARIGVSLVTFGVIYLTTSAMTTYLISQLASSIWIDMLAATGMTTGINIILSTLQGIIAIRVMKVGFNAVAVS